MSMQKPVLIPIVVILLGGGLIFSHWFAYSQGVASQTKRWSHYTDEVMATHALDDATSLKGGVELLRAAVEDPEAFSRDEVMYWKEKVGRWRQSVEQVAIPYLRERGLDDIADEYVELVREGVALESQLQV